MLQTYAVHREDTTREDNRDWLAIKSTNLFYRDGEIKGQIQLSERQFTVHILFTVLYTVLM